MNNISSAVKNGTSTTCVSKCHPRNEYLNSHTVPNAPKKWNGSVSCNMCHSDGSVENDGITVGALVGGHNYHVFDLATSSTLTAAGCADCHPNTGGLSDHQRADGSSGLTLPVGSDGAYINTDVNYNSSTYTCSPSDGVAGCHTVGGEGSWSLM